MTVADVVDDQEAVVVDVDAMDEGVDDPFTEFRVRGVAVAELFDPGDDRFPADADGKDALETRDLFFRVLLLRGQLTELGEQRRACADGAFGERVDDTGDGSVEAVLLLLKIRELLCGVVGLKLVFDGVGGGLEIRLVEHVGERLLHNGALQRVFLFVFLLAGMVLLSDPTGIITIDAAVTVSAFADHGRAAVAAVDLPLQQIRLVRLQRCRSAAPGVEHRLHAVKQVAVDDRGTPVFDQDIFVTVAANIAFMPQDPVDGTDVEGIAKPRFQPAGVQLVGDLFGRCAGDVALEDEPHDRRGGVVDHRLAVFDGIAVGRAAADDVPLQGAFAHSALDVFGEVGRIVFGHGLQQSFEDDAFGVVRNAFGRGNDLHAALFEFGLVKSAVVAATGEAVELPDDDIAERLFLRVGDHALKIGALVGAARDGAVDVLADDLEFVLRGEGAAVAQLSFDRQFGLCVGRIAGVDDNGDHGSLRGCVTMRTARIFRAVEDCD